MTKAMKVWFIVAGALILLGGMIFCGVMMTVNWSFDKYETNTYDITDGFGDITIQTSTSDIDIRVSEGEECKIVCYEREKIKHSVQVKEGVLYILEEDNRAWYEYIGIFSISSPKITIYLPKGSYGDLNVRSTTADIEIGDDFRFDSIDIEGSTGNTTCLAHALGNVRIKRSTGDVRFEGFSAGAIDISTSTGNIYVANVGCQGDIKLQMSTGDVKLEDVSSYASLSIEGSTGNVEMIDVYARNSFNIKRSTGDIKLTSCDANELFIETSTGNVSGTLCSPKIFVVDTSTGSKNVPESTSGGRCKVKTTTGNVNFKII